jgi:hypothetical protein
MSFSPVISFPELLPKGLLSGELLPNEFLFGDVLPFSM